MSLCHEDTKQYSMTRAKDAFTRFSVTNFSSIIEALTPQYKKVIEDFGFGSLLYFDKCFVPNKFAKWVAENVNHRSGDIVLDGKVISLSKESVHLVLGLPMTNRPFPVDFTAGKVIVLSMFGKKSIPSVSFFSERLEKHQCKSDLDVFICFILVAMNSFLCPNSSTVPCYKYFGIFEDIENAKEYDWSGYILGWLIDAIKSFNHAKSSKGTGTLGGCLYYLAVIYLDHVDFGVRRVADSIPRISVWKRGMIKDYVQFDMKPSGSYGYHPLLDVSRTCYSKDLKFLYNPESLVLDPDFNQKLESVSGCQLPASLKTNISKLIKQYCFNCGISVNMDVNSINSLPDDMKIVFCKLLKHAYSIDSRTEKFVLELLSLVANACPDDVDIDKSPEHIQPSDQVGSQQGLRGNTPAHSSDKEQDVNDPVYCSQYELDNSKINQCSPETSDIIPEANKISNPLPIPNLSRSAMKSSNANLANDDIARVMKRLNQNNCDIPSPSHRTSRSVPPRSGYPSSHPLHCMSNQKADGTPSKTLEPHNSTNRNALVDSKKNEGSKRLKKYVSFSGQACSNNDVIMLDNDNGYVLDSVSPSPRYGSTTICSQKVDSNKENISLGLSQRTHIVMQTLDFTPHPTPISKPNFPNGSKPSSSTKDSRSNLPHKVCPEVIVLAERTLSESVRRMTKKSDAIYNSNLPNSGNSLTTPREDQPCDPSSRPPYCSTSYSLPFRASNSTTGGKPPIHGPRRLAMPGPLFRGDYVSGTNKFRVSKSEVQNYKIICNLATSQYQGEDAVNLSGVRCTYWALGESLKPGGIVKTFVVSAFCYSLFLKPNGHPEDSKRHYFFSNIAENLLKDIDEADNDLLARAFKRSHKARPLNHSNMLFFPAFYEDHWFVFVVDTKDKKYVMLDSFFNQNDDYQEDVRERMRGSFEYHWDKYIHLEMGFEDYEFIYPVVPQQPLDNTSDSGIYSMMFIQHWTSPRSLLTSVFALEDIPNIRIKIANDLFFQPKNSWMIQRVTHFQREE